MPTFFLVRAVLAAALSVLAFSVVAQGTMYRYTDESGRTVYTDKPPPSAKNLEIKRTTNNFIETDKISASTRDAMERFPVTLYAFPCGVACEEAEALLQKRGIPYTFVNTQEGSGGDRLKGLTGGNRVPVLQVGREFAEGFLESRWQQLLDQGGYDKDAGVKTTVKHTAAPSSAPAPAAAPASAPESSSEPEPEEAAPEPVTPEPAPTGTSPSLPPM